jgi:hypothetical protein
MPPPKERIPYYPFRDDQQTSATVADPSPLAFNSDVGRMLYTISILLMVNPFGGFTTFFDKSPSSLKFSLVILLLMIRSIRRSRSTVEVKIKSGFTYISHMEYPNVDGNPVGCNAFPGGIGFANEAEKKTAKSEEQGGKDWIGKLFMHNIVFR